MNRIAIVGLGLLGGAVAARLVEAGWVVGGWDLDPIRRRKAAANGVDVAESGEAAIRNACWLITCLPDGPSVRSALLGNGLASCLGPEIPVIDLTTALPAEARSVAAELAARGIAFLDAPVSGSSDATRRGEAVMFVGGPQKVVAAARPLLQAMARRVLHAGPVGAGSELKLVTNLVLGLNRLALAEGLYLAERQGLEGDRVLEALREGAAYSRAMDAKGDRMLRREYEPEARLRQHLKDVRLALALAESAGAVLPVSELHARLLEDAARRGFGDLDNAAIIEALRADDRTDPPDR